MVRTFEMEVEQSAWPTGYREYGREGSPVINFFLKDDHPHLFQFVRLAAELKLSDAELIFALEIKSPSERSKYLGRRSDRFQEFVSGDALGHIVRIYQPIASGFGYSLQELDDEIRRLRQAFGRLADA